MAVRATAKRAVVVMILSAAIADADAAEAGPGEAAGGRKSAGAKATTLAGADHVVLIWYRRDQPLETFQYQTYDVRKGEYTPAVDDWIALMQAKHPRYLVLVRKVDLARERGETDKLRIGSVIHRELLIAAAEAGVFLDAPIQLGPGPFAGQNQASSVNRMPAGPRTDRSFLNSPSTPSIPVYPRTRAP
jgi:hypothetical protein